MNVNIVIISDMTSDITISQHYHQLWRIFPIVVSGGVSVLRDQVFLVKIRELSLWFYNEDKNSPQ